MNSALHSAILNAGLTPAGLAQRVEVDPKTVSRWIGGRLSHPRHRVRVARALGHDEGVLWSGLLKTGHDREVRAVWPYRSAVPRSLWGDLIGQARSRIFAAGYTSYFWFTEVPGTREALQRKASDGVDVRFLLGDKASPVTAERERVEKAALTISTRIGITTAELARINPAPAVRHSDRHISLSVWIFDDDMIVCTHLADLLGHDSPTLHIRRRSGGGLFDRYAEHFGHLWETGDTAESR
nr:XRE family transcriptional regulator [Micromonospora sp. DSM 115978]